MYSHPLDPFLDAGCRQCHQYTMLKINCGDFFYSNYCYRPPNSCLQSSVVQTDLDKVVFCRLIFSECISESSYR